MDRLTARWPCARWFPLVLIVVAALGDALTPIGYTWVPLIAAACVLAGVMMSFRGAAWTGAFALAVTVLLDWRVGILDSGTGWVEEVTVFLAVLIGLDVHWMLERRDRRLAAAWSVAGALQRAVLPAPPTRIGPLRVAARYEAADAEARIGGDAYAIQDTPFGIRVLIGDIRGKGIGAVSITTTLIGAFREAAHHTSSLDELAERLEQSLGRDQAPHAHTSHDEEFTTALIAEIDHAGRTLRLLNRGHPAPYLIRSGRVTELQPADPGLPLGMGDLVSQPATTDTISLAAGDVLLFVTDGVTEARDADGAFYDPTQLTFPDGRPAAPTEVLDTLAEAVYRWAGGRRDDDMATLAISVTTTTSDMSSRTDAPGFAG
ncbi:PP2C family protein-serine/threonine phosphatase [Streptomyces sp. NPDC102283]|uniref:PP2C family protein-serine/threonine phosphatase n=1 Tax=Streptomyces sp. NPDC102283 TaxID=3366155 RepID=UPI0038191014